MANKATKQSGKDLAYHGGKTAAAFVSEALEEMVAEGLDPVIANTIYANETGTQHSTSLKEIARAGLVGGVLGGVLGAGGQVVEYGQGSQVRDIYGEDGVKQLAKVAKESDDDADAFTAEALDKMINEGGGIGLLHQFTGGAQGHQATVFHNADAVGQCLRLFHIVGGEDDGDLPFQTAQNVPQLAAGDDVQP